MEEKKSAEAIRLVCPLCGTDLIYITREDDVFIQCINCGLHIHRADWPRWRLQLPSWMRGPEGTS